MSDGVVWVLYIKPGLGLTFEKKNVFTTLLYAAVSKSNYMSQRETFYAHLKNIASGYTESVAIKQLCNCKK
jgi:hypothetical protein